MKRLAFLVLCLAFLSGCFMNKSLYPVGKTDDDWVKDEKFCRDISGKQTGFAGLSLVGGYKNMTGANDRYNDCLREKGWLK